MSVSYNLIVDGEALNSLLGCRSSERQRLIQFLDRLSADPFQLGDCEIRPPNDRVYQIKFLAPFKITYWADHAIKEVRVVDLQNLG